MKKSMILILLLICGCATALPTKEWRPTELKRCIESPFANEEKKQAAREYLTVYYRNVYGWSDEEIRRIYNHEAWIGMQKIQLIESLGHPSKVTVHYSGYHTIAFYYYTSLLNVNDAEYIIYDERVSGATYL